MKNLDTQQHSRPSPNVQADNHETSKRGFVWLTPELQRALDILATPEYHGFQIQITGQAGCGYHPPTADPAELEEFARAVGLDSSYSIVTGKVSWPVLIDLSSGNGDGHCPKRASQGRPARRIAVVERSR